MKIGPARALSPSSSRARYSVTTDRPVVKPCQRGAGDHRGRHRRRVIVVVVVVTSRIVTVIAVIVRVIITTTIILLSSLCYYENHVVGAPHARTRGQLNQKNRFYISYYSRAVPPIIVRKLHTHTRTPSPLDVHYAILRPSVCPCITSSCTPSVYLHRIQRPKG